MDYLQGSNLADWIQAFSSLAICLIAFVQWRTYEKQSQTMVQQAELTRDSIKQAELANSTALRAIDLSQDTARRELRAYVNLDGVNILFNPLNQQSFIANIIGSIQNRGHTPAYMGSHRQNLYIGPLDNFSYEVFDESPYFSKFNIGSGQKLPAIDRDIPLSSEQYSRIKAGDHVICIYGEVQYLDIFEKPHTATYYKATVKLTGRDA